MKLIKTKTDQLVRTVTGGDLLTAKFSYHVDKAEGQLTYSGPKIQPEVWGQVLSFFKWAHDTAKSEAQVRLFVSTKHQQWKAWAFPQEGWGGLSTKEIKGKEFDEQRAALFGKDDGDWVAWGTVHSHADVSAFQSGTDEADEEQQGGIHITVGDLGKKFYSIHCRLYHREDLFQPDMSCFWDIGDPFTNLSEELMAILPEMANDKIARLQMCRPSAIDFPEQWKSNYKKPAPVTTTSNGNGWHAGQWNDDYFAGPSNRGDGWPVTSTSPFYQRVKAGVEEMLDLVKMYEWQIGQAIEILDEMAEDEVASVTKILKDYNINADELLLGLNRWIAETPTDEEQQDQGGGLITGNDQ